MMENTLPGTQFLTRQDYHTKSWKNGKGQTHDIFLYPEGTGHNNFSLRFALSPIVEEGVFSSFEGADRVITLIEGDGLNLRFDEKTEELKPFQSLKFDTGLTPTGVPVGGPVRVVNVMARRGSWEILDCKPVTHLHETCRKNELIFFFVITPDWHVQTNEQEIRLEPYACAIVSGENHIQANSAANGTGLYARLRQSS